MTLVMSNSLPDEAQGGKRKMIKILKPGTLKEATCDKCGAVLSYDESKDVKEENIEKHFVTNMPSGFGYKQQCIVCPQCKNKISLSSIR